MSDAVCVSLTGCQLLVYPGAFNMTTGPAHWELLARARAIDNQCYVATVSPARDVTASYVAWGHSLVVSPWSVYCRDDILVAPCQPTSFPAECRKRRLNQAFLLCFVSFASSGLCLVCVLSVFLICFLSCTLQREPTRMHICTVILCNILCNVLPAASTHSTLAVRTRCQ